MSINWDLWEEIKRTERGLSGGDPASPLAVELRPGRALRGQRLETALATVGGAVVAGGARGWTRARVPACRALQLGVMPDMGAVRLVRARPGKGGGRLALAAGLAVVIASGLTYSAMTDTWPFNRTITDPEDHEIIWDKHSPRHGVNEGEIKVAGLDQARRGTAKPEARTQPPAAARPAVPPKVRAEGEDRPSAPARPTAAVTPTRRPAVTASQPSTTERVAPLAMASRRAASDEPVERHSTGTPTISEINQRVSDLYKAGLKAYQRGNLKVAVLHWRKALQLEPSRVGMRRSLGLVLYEMGLHQEAVAEFLAILRDHPDDVEALATLELIQRQMATRENGADPEARP